MAGDGSYRVWAAVFGVVFLGLPVAAYYGSRAHPPQSVIEAAAAVLVAVGGLVGSAWCWRAAITGKVSARMKRMMEKGGES